LQRSEQQTERIAMLVWNIIIGVIAGFMAKDHKRGQEPAGYWLYCLIGVVGAFLGVQAAEWAGWTRNGQPLSFAAAIIGASLLLSLFNVARRLRTRGQG
jgi:uncharacterized membrane protein YeaQ/YmgE (transglycosylase-associated protein family)